MEFNSQSKQVLKYANQIGKSLGASALDSQHLLYGLAKCKDSLAGNILSSHDITCEAIKKSFETRTQALGKSSIKGSLEYTPQVKKLLDSAERVAKDTGSVYIGTEHILYAVVTDEKSLAYNLLGYLLKDSGTPIMKITEELVSNFGYEDEGDLQEEYVHSEEMSMGESSKNSTLLSDEKMR